ncbi:hypothetical protein [Leclercia sp.]|uniref:hypothetical protein n=1 Tax=Leclercia sp. TaxID=1898428 RepID=UPI0028AE9656|nr:hypothetical protein [Leclercia sp.]
MRQYRTITEQEKQQIYSLSRAGIADSALLIKFKLDEDTLLKCVEDVFVALQVSRGFKGVVQKKGLLRG